MSGRQAGGMWDQQTRRATTAAHKHQIRTGQRFPAKRQRNKTAIAAAIGWKAVGQVLRQGFNLFTERSGRGVLAERCGNKVAAFACCGVLQIRPADLCLRAGQDGFATFEWRPAVVRHEFHGCHWGVPWCVANSTG